MSSTPDSPIAAQRPQEDRLDSWKEIAAFMNRDIRTVQRWEKTEGLPVHRHLHEKAGSVYAYKRELELWYQSRRLASDNEAPPVVRDPHLGNDGLDAVRFDANAHNN